MTDPDRNLLYLRTNYPLTDERLNRARHWYIARTIGFVLLCMTVVAALVCLLLIKLLTPS